VPRIRPEPACSELRRRVNPCLCSVAARRPPRPKGFDSLWYYKWSGTSCPSPISSSPSGIRCCCSRSSSRVVGRRIWKATQTRSVRPNPSRSAFCHGCVPRAACRLLLAARVGAHGLHGQPLRQAQGHTLRRCSGPAAADCPWHAIYNPPNTSCTPDRRPCTKLLASTVDSVTLTAYPER